MYRQLNAFVTTSAVAAVPAFPDNLVALDRDFVTVEGYQDHVGETATLEILLVARSSARHRPSSRRATSPSRSTTPEEPAGRRHQPEVTPDIGGGDVAQIKFGGQVAGDNKWVR